MRDKPTRHGEFGQVDYAWRRMQVARPQLIRRLRKLGPARRKLLIEAASRLALTAFGLRLLQFRRMIQSGSVPLGRPGADGSIADCVWAVEAAARRVPWRAVCIDQSLSLQRMLRERGIEAVLHYGARQNGSADKPLEAHVWVSVDGTIVIGGEEAESFACIASFPQARD
jgi:hypothetical protein